MAHYIVKTSDVNTLGKSTWKYLKPSTGEHQFVEKKEDAHKFTSKRNALKASLDYQSTHIIQIEKIGKI